MNINITKRALSQDDKSTLESYGVRNTNVFSSRYELTPHGTAFSKSVHAQIPNSVLIFKVPGPNERQHVPAELVTNPNDFSIDSFSDFYQLEPTIIEGSSNPNYLFEALFSTSSDIIAAQSEGYADFAGVFAPQALAAIAQVSDAIASDPFNSDLGFSQSFNVVLPALHNMGAGPNDPPVVINRGFGGRGGLRAAAQRWPVDQTWVGFYVNTNSSFYESAVALPRLFNTYVRHTLEAMGWDEHVLNNKFSEYFTERLESSMPAAPNRKFCLNAGIVDAYKKHVGDENIIAVPMGYQAGREHLFAGGYHADRWDTADFYFANDLKGGPLSQPIPHPALMGEILSTNSRTEGDNHEEFLYKRHNFLQEKYYQPNYIITKAAMGAIGYSFYGDKLTNSTSLNECLFNGDSETEVGQPINVDKIRIRNYSEDKVNIVYGSESQDRHLMIDKNYNVNHKFNDNSVKEALRYFGYVPFGITSPTNPADGRLDSAIVVGNGEKFSMKGIEIFEGGPNVFISLLSDYNIYISANASIIHTRLNLLNLGDSIFDGKGLLYKYFMAEAVSCVIDVGEDSLDLETSESASLPIADRRIRKVLVLHKDFEI